MDVRSDGEGIEARSLDRFEMDAIESGKCIE
jgi:hypothetical protein